MSTSDPVVAGELIQPPVEVVRALDHVRSIFPDVTHVVYTREAKWRYMTDEGSMPKFEGRVDVGILEDAADSLSFFPCVFSVQAS